MSNQDEPKKKVTGSANISDLILNSLTPRTGKETSKWIAKITDDDSMHDAVEAAAREQDAELLTSSPVRIPSRQDAVGFLDYLFDCFQQYEVPFNSNIGAPELQIHVDRPESVTETVREKFQPIHTLQVFRGRVSTRDWTMLVRAHNNVIEGWIIPIGQLITFSGGHSDFTRFLLMQPTTREGVTTWQIDGLDVAWENIRSLAKLLFGALVKVARGESSPNDQFSLRRKASSTKSSADAAPAAEYDFDEHNPDFDSPFLRTGQTPAFKPESAQPPAKAAEKPAASNPAAPRTKGTVSPTAQVDGTKTQPGAFAVHKPKFGAQPVAGDATQAISVAAVSQGVTVDQAIDLLGQAVGLELEKLATAGAEAFSKQDLAAVEKTMKQSGRIKELRDKLKVTLEEFSAEMKKTVE